MTIKTALRRSPWLLWLLVGLGVAVVILGIEIASRRSSRPVVAFASDPSNAYVRPLVPSESVPRSDTSDGVHITSVRNVTDPSAVNYCAPTDPRWGVRGRFPGDTTIIVEQGHYRFPIRLIGEPGEALVMKWAGHSFPIIAVYGGGVGWKQRYVTRFDGRHFMLPIQWDEQTMAWEPYALDRWFDASGPCVPHGESSLEGRCSRCHSIESNASGTLSVSPEGNL